MRKALFSLSGWLMTTALFFFASAVRAQGDRLAPPMSARDTGKAGAAPAEGFRLEPGALAPAQPVASTPPLSASPGPVPDAPPGDPGHAGLGVAKGAGDVVNLDWNGTGPYDVTQSDNPQFTLRVTTLAAGTNGTALSTTVARSVFFDVAARGLGEVSAAVRGIGSVPVIPPVLNTISARGCAVACAYPGDTITMDGANFDPLSVSNFITLNGRPASLNTAAPNTTTHLEATVPFGSTVSGLMVCTGGTCTPRTRNLDLLVTGPEKGLTNIGAVAFDDGRDGAANGWQAWIADRGTNAVYQVDPDLARTQAPTSRLAIASPSIPSLTFKDGAIPVASATGGDAVALLPRAATAPDFSSTRDAGNRVCSGGNSSSVPLVSGMALDPRDSSSAPGAVVWLLDNATGKVRRVTKGTTLADPAGKIDPAVGGFTFAPRLDPFPIVYYPNASVQGIDGNGNVWALGPAPCNTPNYLYVEAGFPDQGYTLSERFDYGWYGSSGRSFARGKSDHIGYVLFALPTTVIRGNDPELFVVPTRPTRVLISKQVATDKYPVDCAVLPADAPCQSANRRYRFTVYSYVPAAITPYIYLHLADPKDTAPYAPAPGAAPAGCDKSVPGPGASADACDNKSWADATDDFGLTDTDATGCPAYTPPAGQTKKWLCVANPGKGGFVSINALITKRYAGDNYQLRASFTNFIPGTVGYDPNYHIKGESGIVTAWKRVYVERDSMFRRGALLEDDFIPSACGTAQQPACNQVWVFDWANVAVNDSVILFQSEGISGQTETAPMKIIAIAAGPRPNSKTITLDRDLRTLNIAWGASAIIAATFPNPNTIDFSSGKSAALGVVSGCSSFNYPVPSSGYPSDCFFNADTRLLPQAMADAFVEVFFPLSGEGTIPYLSPAVLDLYNASTIDGLLAPFSKQWFMSASRDVTGNIKYNLNNYFHLMGFSVQSPVAGNQVLGLTNQIHDWSLLFIKSTEDLMQLAFPGNPLLQGKNANAMIEENTVHEVGGHSFWVNACALNDPSGGHSTDDAWCEAPPNNHCAANPVGSIPKKTIMDETTAVYIAQRTDGIARFSVNELLTAPVCPAPQNGADTRAIRTHHDPE